MQPTDSLINSRTYWWRIRAKDPSGGNAWSVWSDPYSLTVDTSVAVSTWYQTTDSQFATDQLDSTQTNGSGSVGISSTLKEAFTAYAEGTVQSPRYRIWNGSSWGSQQTAVSTGDTIRFVESAAAPTRNEYVIATQGGTGLIKAQVYNNASSTAGNLVSFTTATQLTRRGMDVAYETNSGKAMVVACNGAGRPGARRSSP